MVRWPYRASGAISVSTTGLVPSATPESAAVDRFLDGGQAALDQRGEPGRVPAPPGRHRRLDQGPRQADLGRHARMASIGAWVTSTTAPRTGGPAPRRRGRVRSASTPRARKDRVAALSDAVRTVRRSPATGPRHVDGPLPGGQALGSAARVGQRSPSLPRRRRAGPARP